MSLFLKKKKKKKRIGKENRSCLGVGGGEEEDIRKECSRLNIVEILYSSVEKRKIRPVETILRMEGGRRKVNDRGGEFNYDTL
jgi:hypothetical protein